LTLVSILPLKQKVQYFAKDSALRELILRERDKLEEREFYTKAELWLSLLEIELSKNLGAGVSAPATRQDPHVKDANHNLADG
jgi:hypothetical protein